MPEEQEPDWTIIIPSHCGHATLPKTLPNDYRVKLHDVDDGISAFPVVITRKNKPDFKKIIYIRYQPLKDIEYIRCQLEALFPLEPLPEIKFLINNNEVVMNTKQHVLLAIMQIENKIMECAIQ